MHLLILTHYFPPEFSGDATMQYDLARHMARAGHRVTVITAQPHHHMHAGGAPRLPTRSRVEGFDLLRVRTPRWTRRSLLVRAVQDVIAEAAYVLRSLATPRADVVAMWSPPITLPVFAWVLKLFRGSKLLVYMHDAFPELLVAMELVPRRSLTMRIGERLERFAYRVADYVAVHSPRNRAHVVRRTARPEKIHVWPLWVDTTLVHPVERPAASGAKFVVMYAGTIGYAMGAATIPKAAMLLRDHPEIEFLVVGDGPQRQALQDEISRLGATNVRLLPLQPREKVAEMLAAADVLLVCLRHEATDNPNGYFRAVVPHKLLTSMAAGRPILASTELGGDLADLVRISRAGLVAAAEDPHALAAAVLQMKGAGAQRSVWGKNARRFVVDHLSSEVQLPLLEPVLCALSEGRVVVPENPWTARPVALPAHPVERMAE